MNKIYKVIWSKVRNCYVAVSEIAKRNGKSCTSVNCGRVVGRSLLAGRKSATLAFAVAYFCAVPINAMAANSGGNTIIIDETNSYVGVPSSYDVKIDSGFDGNVYGRNEDGTSSADNAKITITAGTVTGNVYGGSAKSSASYNNVTISGTATINGAIYGGRVNSGDLLGNHVAIVGGVITSGYINGGFKYTGSSGKANNNTVTLAGGEFTKNNRFDIYATSSLADETIDNTINIYGNVKGLTYAWLFGVHSNQLSKNTNKNNELHIGGTRSGVAVEGTTLAPWTGTTGNKVQSVYNFTNIVLHNVKWDTATPVLAAGKFENNFTNEGYYNRGYLDISGMTFSGTPVYGKMALLKSDLYNDFTKLNLKYNNNDPVLLNSDNRKQVIKAGTSKQESSFTKGIKLAYKEKEHAVSLGSGYSSVDYSIADYVTSITFGSTAWGTSRDGSVSGTHFDFSDVTNTNITTTGLSFTNPLSIEKDKTELLLTNATNLAAGTDISHSQSITDYNIGNGVKLNATLNGNVVRTTAGQIGYKSNGTTLNSVNIAGWNGTASAAINSDWLKPNAGSGYVDVTIGNTFSAPNLTPGTTVPILTADSAFFNDNSITDNTKNDKYRSINFTGDTTNKVTFAGTQYKGVKASSDGKILNYVADRKRVATITLGSNMTWGDSIGRNAGSDYSLYYLSSVDATGLSFTNPDEVSGTKDLVTAATTTSIKFFSSISHTQNFTKTMNNDAKVSATLAGTVSRPTTSVIRYTATGTTVSTVDLKDWNNTKAEDSIPTTWAAKTGGVDVVSTGSAVTGLAAGATKVILRASSDNFFGTVAPSAGAYSTETFTNNEGNTGVTLSGDYYKGVNVEDTGRTLKYYAETMDTDGITLGTMTWGTGRTAGDLYIFNRVNSIDATGFSFSNPDAVSGFMYLLSNATGLAANAVADIPHTQADFTTNMGNGTAITATLTGTISTAEAGMVKYTATGTTISTIDLSGWDVSTSSVIPTGWSLKKDGSNAVEATVETANMDATKLSNLPYGSSVPILTATGTAYFDGIKINGANAWNGSGSIVDTDNSGVAIVGTTTGTGVKVDDANKNQIVYQKSKEDITKLTLGGITFAAGTTVRTFDNTYDLTAASIVASDDLFTPESRPLMETGDTMTLVDATGAIKNASNETLAQFNGGSSKSYQIGFTDTIADPTQSTTTDKIDFAGKHTDSLSQEDDAATSTKKSLLTYTVGDKIVETATLSGPITWTDGGTYYTNGMASNQKNRNSVFTFDANSKIDISGVDFTATTDPLNKTMTLISGNTINSVAKNVAGSFTDGKDTPRSFGVVLSRANGTLEAKASGYAEITTGDNLTYTVNGVAIDKINVTSIAKAADTVPTGWTLAKDSSDNVIATVETDGLVVASPSGLEPGETKVIIEAATGSTGFFKDVAVNGSHAWKVDGSTITSDLDIGGVAITGTQTKGGVKVNEANTNQLVYEETKKSVTGITLGEVTFAKDGTARAFDNTYDATAATINGDNLKFTEASAASMETGDTMTILDASTAFKSGGAALVAFADKSYTVAFSETNTDQNVTIAGTHSDTLSQDTAMTKLTYTVGTKDVNTVTLGKVDFVKGSTLFDRSGAGYNYAGVAALGTDGFAVSYASPETVATGDSMTLLQANATLKDMAEQVKKTSYSYTPVTGVTVDAAVTGSLEAKGGNVTYTATANQASKLTFTNVDWKDSGALMTRPSNITFAGADVDTTKINFQNVKELDANKKMTLVSDFGDSVGTITGTKYTVGAGLEGEGAASLAGSDLVFTTKTGVKDLAAQEQTHNTLMVMEAGMAVLAAGNEYVSQTMAELANPQNVSLDGTVTAASLGGSKSRYKTGSHVDSNNWNVAVAVGSKRELKKGSLEWGVFGEYGKSNYTLHSDAGRGDGDSHYAGGGLMAKWTNKHDVYTEASVRLGRLSDTANNLLRDAAGNGYGYDVHANYFGAHVGIGKIIHYKGGKSLDVYGKYFYTKRDGVDFASGGNNYSLDSVASSILRVGARYGTTDKKWNWYGGLAYEYEFDGKSEGTVDGIGIRAASVKGGSVRGEIGLRMSATKTNPWQTDISIYGYGGKHRGFGGSVNVAYMF